MKKIYEAPKAVKHNFETKDIITASATMLKLGGTNGNGVGGELDVMSIDWAAWDNAAN